MKITHAMFIRFPRVLSLAALPVFATSVAACPPEPCAEKSANVAPGAVAGHGDEHVKVVPVHVALARHAHGEADESEAEMIEIRISDGKTIVKINGKEVPASQIRREGKQIRIVDEKGKVVRELPVIVGEGSFNATMHVGGSAKGGKGDGKVKVLGGAAKAKTEAEAHEVAGQRLALALQRFHEGEGKGEVAVAGQLMGGEHPRVMLGVTLGDPDEVLLHHLGCEPGTATLFTQVLPELPAAKAGARLHDVVIKIDGNPPAGPEDVRRELAKREPGDSIGFTVVRVGKELPIVVKLEAFDPEKLSPITGHEQVHEEFMEKFGGVDLQPMLAEVYARLAPHLEDLKDRIRVAPEGLHDFIYEIIPPADGDAAAQNADLERKRGIRLTPREGAGDSDARLERLERRLEEMSRRIEKLLERLEREDA